MLFCKLCNTVESVWLCVCDITDDFVYICIGKISDVVTVHPRAMFIPQEGWTFLSAGECL